ncbi:hypothetical protein [Wenjunlia vitaminophila]|uniref:hypothetical protein n=1 Tax=Wenjunlia vitaminophila TaxID=76728 RepID=UPI001319C6F1|nr:hypothetical protein [Wenjunlia vitaminophila]
MTASNITDAALDDLYARLAAAEQQGCMRTCLVPECRAQMDIVAALEGRVPARPEWDSDGWKLFKAGSVIPGGGYVCPEHAALVDAHRPQAITQADPPAVAARCTCGWASGWYRWHRAARGLWEDHLLRANGS